VVDFFGGCPNAQSRYNPPVQHNRTYLYITAFAGGLVSLAVELAASSLLRPHFGTAIWSGPPSSG